MSLRRLNVDSSRRFCPDHLSDFPGPPDSAPKPNLKFDQLVPQYHPMAPVAPLPRPHPPPPGNIPNTTNWREYTGPLRSLRPHLITRVCRTVASELPRSAGSVPARPSSLRHPPKLTHRPIAFPSSRWLGNGDPKRVLILPALDAPDIHTRRPTADRDTRRIPHGRAASPNRPIPRSRRFLRLGG